MTQSLLREDVDGGVAVLTLNRPPVNALVSSFLHDVATQLTELEQDPSVRGVVIASAFKVFSAGLDLKQSQSFSDAEQTEIVDALNGTFARLFAFPKPVVAAVSGAAIAGGLFFVLSADQAVTHEEAVFGLSEVRVGASFPVGPLEIARATLPPAALSRLMLTGRPVDARRALEIGFVDKMVAPDAVLDTAVTSARELAAIPPKTYAAVKSQMRAPALTIVNAAIADRSDPARPQWFTDETKTAMKAMIG